VGVLACLFAAGFVLCSCSRLTERVWDETPTLASNSGAASTTAAVVEPEPSQAAATAQPDILPLTETPQSDPPTPAATRVVSPDTRYHLQAQLTYNQHELQVAERVAYTHAVLETVSELVFLVEANRYPGSFQLSQLHWADGRAVENYTLQGNRLTIHLPQPLEYGGAVELTLTYVLDLPEIPPPSAESRPQPFGYTSRQTNLVDWYPVLPPYQPGTGWLAHDPGYFGEHQVYQSADYQVEIEITDPINPEQPWVIAASAPAEVDGNLYQFEIEDARNFAWSVSNSYTVASAQVGKVTVYSYFLPFSIEGGEAALQNAADAVALYSQLFGVYPQRSLSIVEADFLDGMEYEGLFFLSRGFYNLYDGTPAGYLTAIAVHETAHQWWYALVGNDQALEPWLDEALCTYSESLFYEHTYPELLDWWWAFRVDFYEPSGVINGTIYDYNGFLPYRNAVYLRGAHFLEGLRQAVGDEAFFSFLRDYAEKNAHRVATTEDFFAILKEHSAVDMEPLLQGYFKAK
jgi:hypothetical protein